MGNTIRLNLTIGSDEVSIEAGRPLFHGLKAGPARPGRPAPGSSDS